MKALREAIAKWPCPDLELAQHRYHILMQNVGENRAWLSEFPDVFDSMSRLLMIERRSWDAATKPEYPASMWDFRENLRRRRDVK